MTHMRTDVLIVGAGPAGLATAIGLASRAVDFLLIDAQGEAQNTSRAAVIHAATLEGLARLGVADRLIAQGVRAPDFRVRDRDEILAEVDFSTLPSDTPYALMIPQDETETILTARLEGLGHRALRPLKLVSFEQTPEGVRALCDGPAGQTLIEARYLIGADGGASVVRTGAGIDFPGETFGSFLLADVRMDWPIPRTEISLFFAEAGTLVVAPMSQDRHRVVAQFPNAPSSPTAEDVQRIIEARGPRTGARVRELIWGSRFQVHHRLADRFRDGCILLVGDAAHVHSPAGGQGMNLGLRDAEALSEAVSQAVRQGQEAALDAYAHDRRESARKVLSMTHRLTRSATLKTPWTRWIRNRLISWVFRMKGVRRRAQRTLAGFG